MKNTNIKRRSLMKAGIAASTLFAIALGRGRLHQSILIIFLVTHGDRKLLRLIVSGNLVGTSAFNTWCELSNLLRTLAAV